MPSQRLTAQQLAKQYPDGTRFEIWTRSLGGPSHAGTWILRGRTLVHEDTGYTWTQWRAAYRAESRHTPGDIVRVRVKEPGPLGFGIMATMRGSQDLVDTTQPPAGFHSAWDNQGATADRFTVVFEDGSSLGMSSNPSSAAGVSMWGEAIAGPHLGKKLTWLALSPTFGATSTNAPWTR